MKKLLILLTSFTVVTFPATQIVSCTQPIDNTYKNPTDIAKNWDFRAHKTISIFDIGVLINDIPDQKIKPGEQNSVTLDLGLINADEGLISVDSENKENVNVNFENGSLKLTGEAAGTSEITIKYNEKEIDNFSVTVIDSVNELNVDDTQFTKKIVAVNKDILETMLKELIVFRFKNQEELYNDETKFVESINSLKFNFYSTSNADNKIPLDIETELIKILGTDFTSYNNDFKTKKIYFTYTYDEIESKRLDLNISNIPTFINNGFENLTIKDSGLNYIDSYFLVKPTLNSDKTEIVENTQTLKFINAILKILENQNQNLKFENKLVWGEYSIKDKTMEQFILLTPEQQVIKWINANDKENDFIQFAELLIDGKQADLGPIFNLEQEILFQKK